MRAAVLVACVAAACGDNLPAAVPPLPDGGPFASVCVPAEPGVLEPVWIAGAAGAPGDVGGFGKPDAILIDPVTGLLLAGDEEPGYDEIHVFDVSDEPQALGDMPGFAAVSGLAADREAGVLYVVEQGADLVRRMRAAEPATEAPFYVDDGTVGEPAADPDAPADGTFVRPQAARVDRLGRLYVSDDARGQAPGARRDVQIFSRDGDLVGALGGLSYGTEPGVEGRLGEPENFALDQARDRVYVCDELTREVVVYRYSDGAYLARFGGFRGIPNGIDVDPHGFIYVMDEGDEEVSAVHLFDPDTLGERWSFGARSEPDDLTPGTFHSADTLVIDAARGLLLVADQGHDRIQAFSLGEIQGRACVASASLWAPQAVRVGRAIPLRALRFGPDGAVDRSRLRETATLRARRVDDGADVGLAADTIDLRVGAGVASPIAEGAAPGVIEITASLGGLEARALVELVEAPPAVLEVSGELVVAAGDRLDVAPGTTVVMAPGARLVVEGDLDAAGTEARPVHVTARDPDAPWGQIVVRGGGRAALSRVFIDGGGDAQRIGHCCPPMILVDGGRLDLDDSVVTGSRAKGILVQEGGHLAIRHSVLAHLGMGVEADRSPAEITSSWLTDFRGPDDDDALYLRGDEVEYLVEDSVLAEVDDDGLDTLDASPVVRRCLVYGAFDKALSLDAGSPIIEDTLIADAALGISFKNIRTPSSSALVRRTTVAGATDACVDVFNADGATVRPRFEAVVVWGCGVPFRTAYDPADLTVEDSIVEGLLPGMETTATVTADPLFLDPPRDYRTHPLSPAHTQVDDAGWPGP
ncbi:MAG TPA: hypothetical protein VMZ28_20065 [Kofleriaceae bacterium]|nr:hypothetical protein [Kofleriaceae bacterium]